MVQIVSLLVQIGRLRTEQLIPIYIARFYKRRLFPWRFKLGLFSLKGKKKHLFTWLFFFPCSFYSRWPEHKVFLRRQCLAPFLFGSSGWNTRTSHPSKRSSTGSGIAMETSSVGRFHFSRVYGKRKYRWPINTGLMEMHAISHRQNQSTFKPIKEAEQWQFACLFVSITWYNYFRKEWNCLVYSSS